MRFDGLHDRRECTCASCVEWTRRKMQARLKSFLRKPRRFLPPLKPIQYAEIEARMMAQLLAADPHIKAVITSRSHFIHDSIEVEIGWSNDGATPLPSDETTVK